ncbi:DUF4376 domain-containing protein [Aureimonas sp. AU22]|uniref:DUF4376 domain-containing protein n=1 Tax=Aureimonas sp. AU22 TaxID=1638162 RepID=UPI00178CB089|nr:DUF4376 domain-containing protein [Aureimonas sp. AU22]
MDGLARTDLANQPDSRRELGFVKFGSYDPLTQAVVKRGDGYAIVPIEAASDPDPADLPMLVEAEKVRRIEAGFPFMGKVIQSRAEDRENIAGAKSAAQDAKLLGAEPGELSWQKRLDAEKGADVFAWITLDNSMLPLDADAMITMGYSAMLHKQRLIFVAKGIKDRLTAGETIADVTADALWS